MAAIAVAAAMAGPGIAPHRLHDHRRLDADLLGLPASKKVENSCPVITIGGANIGSCTRSRVS